MMRQELIHNDDDRVGQHRIPLGKLLESDKETWRHSLHHVAWLGFDPMNLGPSPCFSSCKGVSVG